MNVYQNSAKIGYLASLIFLHYLVERNMCRSVQTDQQQMTHELRLP